jgi:hypothetical protein
MALSMAGDDDGKRLRLRLVNEDRNPSGTFGATVALWLGGREE